jgi:hypothetical protein
MKSLLGYTWGLLVFLICALTVFMLHNLLLVFSNKIYLKLVHTVNGPYDFNFKHFGDREDIASILLEAEIPSYLKKNNLRFKIDKYRRDFDKEKFDENILEYPKYFSEFSFNSKKSQKYFSSLGRIHGYE